MLPFVRYGWIPFILLFLTQCEDRISVDRGSCGFAPPELHYLIYPNAYEGGFFKFRFQDKLYAFNTNQFETGQLSGNCAQDTCYNASIDYRNVLLEFRMFRPKSERDLFYSIGQMTPFMNPDTLSWYYSNSVPSSLRITDYCKANFVAASAGLSLESSYNKFTTVELRTVYSVPGDEYYIADYWVSGEFVAQFTIDGIAQPVSGSYKLVTSVVEKQ